MSLLAVLQRRSKPGIEDGLTAFLLPRAQALLYGQVWVFGRDPVVVCRVITWLVTTFATVTPDRGLTRDQYRL